MTPETTQEISRRSDRYGDKLVELMDSCGVVNLPSVPEDKALEYLKTLKENEDEQATGVLG